MNEKTEVTNDGSENMKKTENTSKPNKKQEKPLTGKKIAAAVAGGVVLGNLAWGMAGEAKEVVDDYIVDAVKNNEDEILPDGGIEPAEVSDVVSDDMSFNEAFAAARSDVGSGGVFEWRGNQYGTFYKEEWDNLSPDQANEYWASVEAADIDIEQEIVPDDIILDENITENNVPVENVEEEIDAEPVAESIEMETADLDGDGYEESILADTNADGNIDTVAADLDMDGKIDTVVADTDHDGEADLFIQDTDGDGEADIIESTNPDELLADNSEMEDDSSNSDFDNDADVSEWA